MAVAIISLAFVISLLRPVPARC